MIYPLRIKGQEYPLSKGDIVVCIADSFGEFTYGKQYTLYSDISDWGNTSSLLPITSDLGNQPLPAYYQWNSYYFLPLSVWRELKLEELGI